jgi:stearoyl-CoA desaturase (delta-9 desaturase)
MSGNRVEASRPGGIELTGDLPSGRIPGGPSARYGVRAGEPPWVSVARVTERHLGVVLAILFVPLNLRLAWLAGISYCIRMWAIEGVYHRYFSHRSFKAGRGAQLVLALIGLQSGQRGPLWWGAKHRDHHKFAETERDPHSPAAHSFTTAYFTWFRTRENALTNLDHIPDFARFPELRWLDRYYYVPFYACAALLFVAGHVGLLSPGIDGISALAWGFYVPSCLVLHSTSLINTLSHMPQVPGGFRRYECSDRSVNRPLLAILTLGAGWHNNHHRHAAAARAGFAWWECDPTYYVLRVMAAFRIIHDVKSTIPEEILREGGIETRKSVRQQA